MFYRSSRKLYRGMVGDVGVFKSEKRKGGTQCTEYVFGLGLASSAAIQE